MTEDQAVEIMRHRDVTLEALKNGARTIDDARGMASIAKEQANHMHQKRNAATATGNASSAAIYRMLAMRAEAVSRGVKQAIEEWGEGQ